MYTILVQQELAGVHISIREAFTVFTVVAYDAKITSYCELFSKTTREVFKKYIYLNQAYFRSHIDFLKLFTLNLGVNIT